MWLVLIRIMVNTMILIKTDMVKHGQTSLHSMERDMKQICSI